MSDNKDTTGIDGTAVDITTTDEVLAKLGTLGVPEEKGVKLKQDLGVETLDDLAIVTEDDLVSTGWTRIAARRLAAQLAPVRQTAEAPLVSNAALEAVLPNVQDDESWLKALKTGGVLKVDQSTVIGAVRAALAKRVGLYDVPGLLTAAMEAFADESEEQVDPTFYQLREQMTRRSYADIFAAVPGLNGSFVTDKRKNQLLARLNDFLWPAVISFNTQLKGWQESWMQGAANPGVMMMALMGGGGALPPGVMQAPDTAAIRDAADAVKDAINKAFAGTGVQISAALAYEAQEIKKSLEDPRLPALVGVANREQLLKKLGVAVPATYPRLETNLTKYVLGVLGLEDQAAGNEELSYLGALFMLGSQIDWSQLGGGRSQELYSRLGKAGLRSGPYDARLEGSIDPYKGR